MFDIRVKLATKHILHLSHLSIDIILEATATTIVQFEQKDILQLVTFVFIYIYKYHRNLLLINFYFDTHCLI